MENQAFKKKKKELLGSFRGRNQELLDSLVRASTLKSLNFSHFPTIMHFFSRLIFLGQSNWLNLCYAPNRWAEHIRIADHRGRDNSP